jgi:choline dehydrogenase-like flavoprotein
MSKITGGDVHYDVIVVGTGPGGATTAKELTARGKKVLILEWGPKPTLKGSFWQYVRFQAMPGKSLLLTEELVGLVRGIITGGSSVFYYATCFPVPFEMLKSHGLDITEEEKEARAELPIAPLKDQMMTPMATRIMESALSLGYKWNRLDKFMHQDRWRPGMQFGYYGDPHGVKWNGANYIEEALAQGATLVNGAKVQRAIIENSIATGVEYKVRGKTRQAFADKVVVSAGGIGSPMILRKSGIDGAGRDFFFDPLISVCGKVKDLKARDEIPMSAGIHMVDEGYMMTDMALPPMLDALFSLYAGKVIRAFSPRNNLRIMVKAKDSLGGRLTDRGGVRKPLTEDDRQKLDRGYERAREILKAAGAKGIFRTTYLAAHPGGTVKIGEYLDADLKVKGIDNLHVCDCSVLPEAWGLPPTLTLVCLAKRLAKHLAPGKIPN